MANQLNEVKKLQRLAGLINESNIYEEQNETQDATEIADELENSSAIDAVAKKIAKDKDAVKQLMGLLKQSGVNPASLSENVDDAAIQKLAAAFTKKAQMMNEEEGGFDYGGAAMAGLIGGGTLAHYLFRKEVINAVGDVAHTAAMGPSMIGAVVGAILFVVGKKVYDMLKGDNYDS